MVNTVKVNFAFRFSPVMSCVDPQRGIAVCSQQPVAHSPSAPSGASCSTFRGNLASAEN